MNIIKYEKIKEFINGQEGNGCELLIDKQEFESELIKQNKSNTKIKLKIRCACNDIFFATYEKFKHDNKRQCNKCGAEIKRKKFVKTQEQFEQELYNLVGDEYTVLGKYINTDTTLNIRHNSKLCDNYIWNVRPSNIIRGDRCPVCSCINVHLKQRKTHEQFCDEVYHITKNEFSILSEYTGAFNEIIAKHNMCGCIFKVPHARDILNGRGCPECNESSGEKQVRLWLVKNNIFYTKEYTFKGLVSKAENPLRYDFAVFDNNNKLNSLIEYDGQQHFYPVNFKGRSNKKVINEFADILYNDALKNSYCEDNNIRLLRIPYWEYDDIEKILNKEFTM